MDGMLLPINFRETAIALQSNQNIRAAVSIVEEELHSKTAFFDTSERTGFGCFSGVFRLEQGRQRSGLQYPFAPGFDPGGIGPRQPAFRPIRQVAEASNQ
uniref:Uncharacterized protein n=1 Tax=Candidatus Kentrum sp. DK TaxID=2126562 RepID=A0A450T0X3_9GAMM|nr:MAG: hypothetical protein BECKDK2373C_GA0170839_107811 [Candidatus Kentron sp. DK]